jgi:hypothetical protein
VVESDVGVKSGRRNSIAAWLAEQYAEEIIERKQVYRDSSCSSGSGGGKCRVEDRE